MRFRLRRITQSLHARVERHLDLEDSLQTLDEYRKLLELLWGFHSPLERLLREIDWKKNAVAIADRCKTTWLETDLNHIGENAAYLSSLRKCEDLPRLDDVASGLGALYVVEGSTLGGQVILRTLKTRFGLSPDTGGRFFWGYGSRTSVMWQRYLAVLEEFTNSAQTAEIVEKSAIETFEAFDRWFNKFHLVRTTGRDCAPRDNCPARPGPGHG